MRELIEHLQSRSWISMRLWPAYVCAVAYGVVAALDGAQFFKLYSAVVTVVLLLHDSSERRIRMQTDVLARLFREIERKQA